MREKIKTIAFAAVVSALAVAGLAIAQDDGGDGAENGQPQADRVMALAAAPGGPAGPAPAFFVHGPDRDVTWSEVHLRRDGEDATVRTDYGRVTGTDGDSIAIERNDGEAVDVPVDDETSVLAGPRNREAGVEDIPEGRQVIVLRRDGDEAAELVAVRPKHPLRLRLRGGLPRGKHFGPAEIPAPPPIGDGE